MERKEEIRFLDQARVGEDLEELNREQHADATPGRLQPDEVDLFTLITEEMVGILEGQRPFLDIDSSLDPALRCALQALFEAHTSRDGDTNEFVSGMARNKLLNQSLMQLQPILAVALRPDFREGRAMYDRLVGNMNQLRDDIKSSILSEMPVKIAPAEEKAEEQDEDEPPPGEDDEAGDEGDEGGDDAGRDRAKRQDGSSEGAEGEASAAEKSEGSWFGRLLKRRGKDKDDEGSE